MLNAHLHARIFDGVVKRLARARLAVDLQAVATEDLHVRRDGNVDVTVERVAEERASLFFNADDSQGQSAQFQDLSNRISIWEELVFHVSAEYANERRATHFIVGNEPAGLNGFVLDVGHGRGRAHHAGAGKLDAVLFQV